MVVLDRKEATKHFVTPLRIRTKTTVDKVAAVNIISGLQLTLLMDLRGRRNPLENIYSKTLLEIIKIKVGPLILVRPASFSSVLMGDLDIFVCCPFCSQ